MPTNSGRVLSLTAILLFLLGCDEPTKYPLTEQSDLQIRFVDAVDPDSVRPEDLGSEVVLDETDLEYIFVSEDEHLGNAPGRFGLSFKLKPEAAARFAELTRENVGKRLAIISRGEVLNTAAIRGEIEAYVMVTAQLERAEAEAQLAKIVENE